MSDTKLIIAETYDEKFDAKHKAIAGEAAATLAMPVQRKLVLEYLQAGRTLTNLVAITNLGIGSLTSRVAELRGEGYLIKDEWREDFGGKRYKAYWLPKEEALG